MAETTETTATGVADTTKAEETAVKTFTQEEVNGIVTKQSKSAVEKLLKEAGIASEGDYKASMAAFKKWQDKSKSALELKESEVKTLKATQEAAELKANSIERQLAAVANGIPADKPAKYIKLAEAYVDEATDFKAALVLALKDFPLQSTVPGAGGNPPPGIKDPKKPLPTGTVTF